MSLSEPRRQRQRESHQTKGLMSSTMAVHVNCVFVIRPLQNSNVKYSGYSRASTAPYLAALIYLAASGKSPRKIIGFTL